MTGEPQESNRLSTKDASAGDFFTRLRTNAFWCLGGLVLATGLVTRSLWQAAGALAAGMLVMANFGGLLAVLDHRLRKPEENPKPLHVLFLSGRLVLLGLGLYAIVLVLGVGPIPVAVGLSVLVLALLLEALKQLLRS